MRECSFCLNWSCRRNLIHEIIQLELGKSPNTTEICINILFNQTNAYKFMQPVPEFVSYPNQGLAQNDTILIFISISIGSDSVIPKTDDTMAKRKGTKWQITIYKTLHIKSKNEPHKNQGSESCAAER